MMTLTAPSVLVAYIYFALRSLSLTSGSLALAHRGRHGRPGGVNEGHYSEEHETNGGLGVDLPPGRVLGFVSCVLAKREVAREVGVVIAYELVVLAVDFRIELALGEAKAPEAVGAARGGERDKELRIMLV